jgi:Pheromone A receptor
MNEWPFSEDKVSTMILPLFLYISQSLQHTHSFYPHFRPLSTFTPFLSLLQLPPWLIRTNFSVPFLSSVFCCAPFPFIGIWKVSPLRISHRLSFLTLLLDLAWNAGTSLYIAWAGLGCLKGFINSVVWNSTVSNVAPVWCDLSLYTFFFHSSTVADWRRLYWE